MSQSWRNGLCSGICGADSCGLCMGSWFCAPCLYGRVDQRYKRFPDMNKKNYDNVACNGGCWLFCLAGCFGVHFLPIMMKRGDIRENFDVKGNCCTDCLAGWCCTPCSLAQMETELKDRAANPQMNDVNNGSMIKQGQYAPNQDPMNYQPPQRNYQHDPAQGYAPGQKSM